MTAAEIAIALVDVDSTVGDYVGGLQHQMNALRGPGEPPYEERFVIDGEGRIVEREEAPHERARRKLIQSVPGFWQNLAPIPLGFEVVALLRELDFTLHVVTKGPKDIPGAWSEKMAWCREHLPDAFMNISSDKSLHYGRVLVDDWPPYFEPWLDVRPRGLVVCVAQPWNLPYAPGGARWHAHVFRYDGTNHTELRAALIAARHRRAEP